MKTLPNPRRLNLAVAHALLEEIQAILWGDAMEDGHDPDEIEWGSETLDDVANALHAAGIGPRGGK